jgi:hypothetical protein
MYEMTMFFFPDILSGGRSLLHIQTLRLRTWVWNGMVWLRGFGMILSKL